MRPYKACSCRNPETGLKLGKKCPDLKKRHHGKWYGRYTAPPGPDGKRRQPRIGPYDTETECKKALAKAAGKAVQPGRAYDSKIRLGEYLEKRYAWRLAESEGGDGLKRSTLKAEREIIDLYLKPGLGHVKLVGELGSDQIRELYAAMRLINRPGEEEQPSDLLRRLLEARAAKKASGGRYSNRPLGPSRIKRVHAVLTGALNDAVKVSKILDTSPAEGVLQTKGGGRKGRAKPLVWTAERVAHWEKTGKIPAKVMVWTSEQCGAFLDFAVHDRLYALWHLDAYYGQRRGELVGLERPDISLDRRRMHLRQAQPDDDLDDVKSDDSDRHIVFDEDTERVLRAWCRRQAEERLAWGEAWIDSGRFFTREDGRELRPAHVSQRFKLLVEKYQNCRRQHAQGWSIEKIAPVAPDQRGAGEARGDRARAPADPLPRPEARRGHHAACFRGVDEGRLGDPRARQ